MKLNWKIIIGVLFAAAVLLGLFQHVPDFGNTKTVFKQPGVSNKSLSDYYRQSQQLQQPTAAATTTETFLAVGDIMLSRNVALAIEQNHDINYPFAHMAEIFNPPAGSQAFNFANLESPIAASPKNTIVGGHSLIFGAPADNLAALKKNNFKVLNLANNHAFDQGLSGLDDTRSALDALGLAHEGTGDNLGQAWEPAIINAAGLKTCFIGASFASINDGGKSKNDYVARIEDTDYLKSAITEARTECDFVVVAMHAGTEYTRRPNLEQTTFAHTAIDDGADMVIGAHPHWVQTIEKYQGKYIFYSLGNFIFDQNFSEDTKEGLALKIQVSKIQEPNQITPGAATSDDLQGTRKPANLNSIELIPVIIENSQPRPATAAETKKILNKIGQTGNILYP